MAPLISIPAEGSFHSPWKEREDKGLILDLNGMGRSLMKDWKKWILFAITGASLGLLAGTLLPKTYVSYSKIKQITYSEFQPFLLSTQNLNHVPSREGLFNLFMETIQDDEVKKEYWINSSLYQEARENAGITSGGIEEQIFLENWIKKMGVDVPLSENGKPVSHGVLMKLDDPEVSQAKLYEWMDFVDNKVIERIEREIQLGIQEEIAGLKLEDDRDLERLRNSVDQQRKHYKDALIVANNLNIDNGAMIVKEPELFEKAPLYMRGTKWLNEDLKALNVKLEDRSYISASADRKERIDFLTNRQLDFAELHSFSFIRRPTYPSTHLGIGAFSIMMLGGFLGLLIPLTIRTLKLTINH